MKVLITGVTGLIGSHLADFLSKEKSVSQVWGLRRFRSSYENIAKIKNLKLVDGEITDPKSMETIFKKIQPDIVFHLAAQSYPSVSWDAPWSTLEANILGTLNILEAARKSKKLPKVFLACSSAEYGLAEKIPTTEDCPLKPVSPYGVSKVTTEALGYQYFVNFKIPVYLGRFFIQVGPGQDERTSIQTFCKQMAAIEKGIQPPIIKVGNLKPKRDFLDVRDGIAAIWLIVNKGKPGEIYNICSGKAPSMREVLNIILKLGKKKAKITVDSARLRPNDEPIIQGSHKRLTLDTGWKPEIPLSDTVLRVLDYWREKL